VALDEAALKALLVGKYTWVRNNVTGGVFKVQWADNGQMLVMNVDPRIPLPSEVGDVTSGSYLGTPSGYAIRDGKVVTTFGNAEFDYTVYKVAGGSNDMVTKGDTYLAARSNEFGYANYEIVPTPEFLGTEVKDATVPK